MTIIEFFNHPFFIVFGALSTIISILSVLYIIIIVFRGVVPVWYRLGRGLSERKISIFAEDEYDNLFQYLVDSKIFNKKNILRIDKKSLDKVSAKTIFLVHWKCFRNNIQEILDLKEDSTPLIIYAPQEDGPIEEATLTLINLKRNSIIVNFRGRLLNDILVSMITTSYEKR